MSPPPASTSSVRRILIPGPPSLSSRFFWWLVKLLLPLLIGPPPVPPKGPQQIWDSHSELPTSLPRTLKKAIARGEVDVSAWREESSGWVIPVLRENKTRTGDSVRGRESARPKRAALYFHGGAYTRGLAGVHWTWVHWLAGELDAEFYVVPYPLAPTNIGLEVMPVLLDIYKSFLERTQGQEVLFVGDSAGAVITLGLAFAAHRAHIPLPHQIIAVSPGVDLTMLQHAASVAALAPYDPMITPDGSRRVRRMWAGLSSDGTDSIPAHIVQDPVMNPSVGDLSIFKEAGTQLVVVSGTWDTMHPAIEEFVREAERKGALTVYIEGESQIHVFPMTRRLVKEGDVAARAMVEAVLVYSET